MLLAVAVAARAQTCSSISLVPSTLPSATVNTPYNTALSNITLGGTPPYQYASAGLPAWMSINPAGAITGTPTTLGPFAGSVSIVDSSSPQLTATCQFNVQVLPQPLTINTSTLPLAVQNIAYSQPVQVSGGYPPYAFALFRSSLAGTGLSLDPNTGIISGSPSATGQTVFRVQVVDSPPPLSQQSQAFQTITLQINPPLAISTAPTLTFALQGQPYSLQLSTQAGTGGPNITWSALPNTLPAGLTLDPTGLLHGMPTVSGSFSFAITASDGFAPAVLNATLAIYAPLVISTTSLPNGAYQQSYGPVNLTASGGSGSVTWTATGLPPGLGASGNSISGMPTALGQFKSISISVKDNVSGQTASQPYSMTVSYPPISIAAPPLIDLAAGGSFSVNLSASGGLGPYQWLPGATLPQGFSLSQSGTLSGSPTQPGDIGIPVQVTDSQPQTASTTIPVKVLGIANTSPLTPGTTVSTYSASFSAVSGVPPYTFSASGLPAGLSLSSAGVLTGSIKQSQTINFTVTVTDSNGISASSPYSLTFSVPGPLTIAAPALSDATVNVRYSASVNSAATGGQPPYQWSVQAGTPPPGISLSSTGVLSGSTTASGSYSFTIEATDGAGATVSTGVTLQIDPAPLSITTQSPLPSGIVNIAYPQQVLAATGGTGSYTFSITSGALPDSMNLTNGVIGGTPTASGDFSVTITATDAASKTATAPLAIHVRPPSTDLILSAGTLSFSLQTGATTLPASQSVSVSSSDISQVLEFSTQLSPGAGWLSVSSATAAPAALSLGLTTQALSLPASPTPYTATITLTCTSSQCASPTPQTITVSLSVTTAPALLSVTTDLLSFSATSSPPVASSQPLLVTNSGGGSLGFASVTCEASWCQVGSYPAALSSGASAAINITADPTGLPPDYYRTTIDIVSSAGTASVPVTLLIASSSQMLLAPSGVQLEMPQGGALGNPNGSFLVSVSGNTTLNWSAAALSAPPWLVLNTTSGTASGSAPGTVSFSIDPTAAAALTAGANYATIEVTVPGALNSPQDFQIVFNVTATGSTAAPDPEPAGLVFITEAGSTAPPQTVQVFASSSSPIGYQASASTNDGAKWLSVSPLTGTTSATAPAQSAVSVDATSLAPGVYRGGVTYSFLNPPVQTANVTLIVTAPVAAPSAVRSGDIHSNTTAPAGCKPSALAPAPTGVVNNFSAPASWPTPLAIQLLDDCGNTVPKGQIIVTFTNGDPPLALGLANSSTALYSGTWTPRNTGAQVSLNARATASGFPAANLQLTGAVIPNVAPVLKPNGTLHGFNPQIGGALAPGTIVQINGTGLASLNAPASVIPLPTNLNGTSVIIGGVLAPLFSVSPGQIEAQIPFELSPGNQYQVIANANGAFTTPLTIQLTPAAPGFATLPDGTLLAQHASDLSAVNSDSPAKPGELVIAYLAGMGATNIPVSTGGASPSDPLAYATVGPVLTLNGVPAPITFTGMTPGLVGVYQVDFQVPAGTPDGTLTVALSQDIFSSNSATLPVHQ